MAFQELMQTGGAQEKRELGQLQNDLQSDDPINIQFTSVSNTSFPLSTPSAVITGIVACWQLPSSRTLEGWIMV